LLSGATTTTTIVGAEEAARTDAAIREADARLTHLYDTYRGPVYRFCRGHLRSKEEADDAVQSTFLRAFTALRRGVKPDVEAAWLFKIAHNVCLSRRLADTRRARVEYPRDFEQLQEQVAPDLPELEELSGLNCALAAMPAHLRQVILLREWQGLSYAEIAEVLEVSHSAVETRVFRARRCLARALQPEPVADLVAA
jgi:RNA polymerase sigma-70 factor (ECF subfamily)